MCNRDIHIQFLKMDQSYCLYYDKYLKVPQYIIIKCHDICDFSDNYNYNYIVHDNAKYCCKCGSLIKYFYADLQPYENYNKKNEVFITENIIYLIR